MKRLSKSHAFLVIVLMALLVCPLGCKKEEPQAKEIKIGAILPLTGEGAKYGQSAKRGIELAIKEINSSGGIHGKNISVVFEDSLMDPKQGVSAIRKMIGVNKVPVIIGAMASSVTLAVAPIAEKNKVVLLSPVSSTPALTEAGDYIFRNTYSDTYEGSRMGSYVYRQLNYKRVGMLHVNNDYGVGLTRTFREVFTGLGGIITAEEAYDSDSSDFKSQLHKIKESDPNAIYLVGYTEMGQVLKQVKELGIVASFMSCIMFEDPKILEIAGAAAEGVIYAYPAYDTGSDQENVSTFVKSFKAQYDLLPDIYAASSYDAATILASAMRRGGISAEQIRDALYSIRDFPGVTGKTTFDEKGDVEKSIGIKKVRNGTFIWVEAEF